MPLEEIGLIGNWHGHLFTLRRRQCVMFVHNATRYMLFLPGLRKEHFAELGSKWFRELFIATLATFGCPDVQIRKVELALGPVRFDTAVDRSVQGSLRIARFDLETWLSNEPDLMKIDPIGTSCRLSHRPTTIRGKFLWPDEAMLEAVAAL